MNSHSKSLVAGAVASTLALAWTSAFANSIVRGVVAGAYFTPPVISDSPTLAKPGNTVASTYAGAKVCFDVNNNGVCDAGEPYATTAADGSFLLASVAGGPLVAEIPTTATNGGNPVTSRNVFRAAQAQVAASTINPILPANVAVTPISTEIARSMDANGLTFAAARDQLAQRLNVSSADALLAPGKVLDASELPAILQETVVDASRFELAAKFVDRADPSYKLQGFFDCGTSIGTDPGGGTLACPASELTALQIKDAQQAAMNLEGIPRYDHVFILMLENKATSTIKGSAYAPHINALLNANNQFTSYFATGNPSEPNYTALGGADDFGITDDNQWNENATGANAVQDLVIPTSAVPGLAASPFTNPYSVSGGAVHNIVGHANLFNALTSKGLNWRTYAESMNPGQDPRTDSVADPAVVAPDHVYAPGTVATSATSSTFIGTQLGNPALLLPQAAQLYRTKHHPGMAYQNVRSAPEFVFSNRTLGGGQWDAAMATAIANQATTPLKYPVPSTYVIDQFSADLQSGDIGAINFVIPDQCDDMHGITVTGTASSGSTTASDCAGPAANAANYIVRGDNYTQWVVSKIESSAVWNNPYQRVAIVVMFDEGTATAGFNSCCGWNPGSSSVAQPVIVNPDGSVSVDPSIQQSLYTKGNRGHGESVFGVITNQASSPKGIKDNDVYSHFSFVRTLQDMFGLADPGVEGSYMNRSKYTENFIAAHLTVLPEFAGSADRHFDSVRAMNHVWVAPATYTQKQSTDVATAPQTGPDAVQTNIWAL